MCVRRKQSTQQTPTRKKKTMKRDFYGNYASPDEVVHLDEDLHTTDMSFLYPWCPSVRQGGKRKSARLVWKECQRRILETTREKMKHFPISQLIRRRHLTTTQTATISTQQTATQPDDLATTQQAQTVEEEATIDNLLTQKSKRRLIQISFEIMRTPDEFDQEENNQWMGQNGIVNAIRDFIGLKSHRARSQILSVLRCVKQGQEQGVEIDVGKKINAQRSDEYLSRGWDRTAFSELSSGGHIQATVWRDNKFVKLLNTVYIVDGAETVTRWIRTAANYFSVCCSVCCCRLCRI